MKSPNTNRLFVESPNRTETQTTFVHRAMQPKRKGDKSDAYIIYSPPHSNMHFIEHLVHSKTELTERRGGPRLQPPRYPRRRWLRETRGGGAGGRRAPRRGRGAARSRRPARGPRPRAAPLRSRRCGGAPRTGAARAPAAQARARSFRRDGRGAGEDEGLGGVTAAAAEEGE